MHYPVPKKLPVKVMNDLHPVALTSSVMKVFERVMLLQYDFRRCMVTDFVHPLQFDYRQGRSADDAILYVLDHVYSHLDKPATSIHLMLYDFCSAFNTIQPRLLAEKLLAMNVHPTLIYTLGLASSD